MSQKTTRSIPPPPPRSARYEFGPLIGAGGCGFVYRGFDRDAGTPVAIKLLKARVTDDPRAHVRFATEFKACRQLDHPNIVRAYDFVSDGSTAYAVYELVEGQSLVDRLERSGPLPEAEAVGIVAQMTQALDFANDRAVIHRDVKPDNILLRPDGVAKLTDFGLAKDYNDDQDLTRPAGGLGTPAYMAPEQFAGAKYVDRRADVYSLAATLYDLLTGQPPFEAKTVVHILTKKERREFVPPAVLVPTLSPGVDAAVVEAMDPDPDRRPPTCLEFFRRLTTAGPVSRTVACVADDRRSAVRYAVRLGAAARVAGDPLADPPESAEAWPMVVRDVSASGLGFVLARRFEPGTELAAELTHDPARPGVRSVLRVVRVRPEGHGLWRYGCVFVRPPSDADLRRMGGGGER